MCVYKHIVIKRGRGYIRMLCTRVALPREVSLITLKAFSDGSYEGWRTEVVFVSAAAAAADNCLPRRTRRPNISPILRRPAHARPLNEPYLRQTNPIQLRVPDNIHRDAFMAVNFAFLRARTHAAALTLHTSRQCLCVCVCACVYIIIRCKC